MALDMDGNLNGSVTMSCDGYSAIAEREQLNGDPGDSHFKNLLLESLPEAKVDTISFDNQEDLTKPLKALAKCSLPNMAMVNGDFMYLAPALIGSFRENPLKLEQRIYPVDYATPFKERIVLNLAMPEGYVVEDLPEPVNVVLPNDGGSFKFQMTQQATGLQLVSNIQINQLHFEPEEYGSLRNFFNLIAAKLGEQLVLKKA